MAFTADFIAGLAQLLEDAGAGAWKPEGTVYTPGETAIVPGAVPSQPDRLITLTPYLPVDDPTQAETSLFVQVRTRGTRDLRTSSDLQDTVFNLLQNLPRTQIGGVTVASCWRRSGGYLGTDTNGRHSDSSNYEFRLHRPSTHRA